MAEYDINPWKILLIDDDEEEYIIARGMLAAARQDRYEIDWEPDCRKGIKRILGGSYDAVLIDYLLESANGIDLIRDVRARGSKTPIILITGYGSEDIDREAMQAGATDFLDRNDLSIPLLERTLRYIIRNHRMVERARIENEERQAQLEAERARLKAVIDNAPAGIVMTDTAGRFTVVNRGALELFPPSGITGDASGPVSGYSLRRPDGQIIPSVELPLMLSLKGEIIVDQEVVIRHEDGKEVTILVNTAPIYGPNGHIIGAVAVMNDITEYERTQQELRDSQERERERAAELEAIMDAVPAAMWISRDMSGSFIYANRFGYEILRMQPGENTSKSDPENPAAKHFKAMKDGRELLPEELPVQVAAQGIPVTDYEFDLVFDNGTVFHLLGNATPILDQDGKPAGAVSAFIDITDRKNIEQLSSQRIEDRARIEIQRRIIEQREQERMQIAREIHDGPLQDLIGVFYRLIELSEEVTALPEAGAITEGAKDDLQNAINELRSYASQLRPPILSNFGLEKAIRAHLEEFGPKHPELRVIFEAGQEGDILPDTIRTAMYRIYQEMLNNVVKHAQASEVNIRFYKNQDYLELEVRDNGRGFVPPKDWVELARQKHLGLVGIQERTEAVGGRLEVITEPGQGTAMRVIVPLKAEPGDE